MPDWQQFHFIRPDWLWLLLPAAGLTVLTIFYGHKRSDWYQLIAPHLSEKLVKSDTGSSQFLLWFAIIIALLLSIIALAGPSWERLPQPVFQLERGKVIVMDMSLSMRATDIKPNRLTRARFKAIDLIKATAEGDIGLVAYAGDGFVISPLTSDAKNLTTLIPALSPEIMPVLGSDPYTGLQTASDLLTNAGFLSGDIFWITDGVNPEQVSELQSWFRQSRFRVSALLVGTPQGAPIELTNGQQFKDRSGQVVVPKSYDHHIRGLTAQTGGLTTYIQADDSDIRLFAELSAQNKEATSDEPEEPAGDQWQEAGPWLLIPVLIIFAFCFRRGWLLCVPLALVVSLMMPAPVYADVMDKVFKTPDQQGKIAFESEKFDQAAALFERADWSGTAYYRAAQQALKQNDQELAEGYFLLAKQAFSRAQGVQSKYNEANATAYLGELEEAIGLYQQVIDQQPDHQQAIENKSRLEAMLEQQRQEQQQQQSQQNQQQSQQNQQQSSSQEQSDQQQQADQQGEQQQENEQQSEPDPSDQGDPSNTPDKQPSDSDVENQMQLDNLLKKVPDDPGYLLKRKMMFEYQKRRRDPRAAPTTETW